MQGTKKGIEISSDSIRLVEVRKGIGSCRVVKYTSEGLPEGLISPSIHKANIADSKLFKDLLGKTTKSLSRSSDIALSIPDQLVRVSVLEFEEVPESRNDIEKLIAWRIKKALPFPVEAAKIDFAILGKKEENLRVVFAVSSIAVIREYEDALRGIGLRPRIVDISSLNTVGLLQKNLGDDFIFVNVLHDSVGIAIVVNGKFAFFRSKELEGGTERIVKETISTVNYFRNRHSDSIPDRLYLFSAGEAEDLIAAIARNFSGEVSRVNVPDYLQWAGQGEGDTAFYPAIGAALRL